jgi:tetraacyldisaccharide 4'-kinase
MKAPVFWYKPMGEIARVLAPLGQVYRAAGILRRRFASPYQAKVPVICVGNIVAGGSGKTPTALALAQLLREKGHKPVFVTRGYGGKLHGPLRVDIQKHTAREVGDEALLLARVAPVWIGRNRAAAVREAEKFGTYVILDDGLQNPSVKQDISFLVVDGATGFGNGKLIPAGPLRETLMDALARITAVVLIGERDEQNIALQVGKPVLRARLVPNFPEEFPRQEKFLAFAGIGHPEKFFRLCHQSGLTLTNTKAFADHHVFTASEQSSLQKQAYREGARLLTTEKDWMRLPPEFRFEVLFLPINLAFDEPDTALKLLA